MELLKPDGFRPGTKHHGCHLPEKGRVFYGFSFPWIEPEWAVFKATGNWACHASLLSASAANSARMSSSAVKTSQGALPLVPAMALTAFVSSSETLFPFQQLSAKATSKSSICIAGLSSQFP